MSVAKNTLRGERVWEIDAYRGYRVFLLLASHLYLTVTKFCIDGLYNIDSYAYVNMTDPLHFWFDWGADGVIYNAFLSQEIIARWTSVGLAGFFIVSGICCSFTKNNFNRSVRLLIVGYLISAVSFGIAAWTGEKQQLIRFGAIQCYGACHLIYSAFLEKRSSRVLVMLAIPVLLAGYYFKLNPVYSEWSILYPLGIHEKGFTAGEYLPILPYLGWLLLGVVWGRKFYADRKSLFPWPIADKLTRPLQWLGRYSGILYVIQLVAYPTIFYGLGYIFHLF